MSSTGLVYVNQPLTIEITIAEDLTAATGFKGFICSPGEVSTEYVAELKAGATSSSGVVTFAIPENALNVSGKWRVWCSVQLEAGGYYFVSSMVSQVIVYPVPCS
jgi:hypothetical protein